MYNLLLAKQEPLNIKLKELADKYNVGIARLPVAWAIAKGTFPIIGVAKVQHVEDVATAVNGKLTVEDINSLETLDDSLNINVIRYGEKEMKSGANK